MAQPDRNTNNPDRDYPATLRRNLAAQALGQHIFDARSTVYGNGGATWDSLSPEVRANYVTRATELISTLTPRVIVTGLRLEKVIGVIYPEGRA